ncbi:MAG: helix-turn-helix domain-containing protein [Myxococcaceae bacterium]
MKLVARDSLVSVPEAAKALGVSVSTVWRKLRRGELKSVRKSGRRYITERELRGSNRPVEQPPEAAPFTRDHPMWRLAGAFKSGGIGPGSEDKHAILDE